MIPKKHKECYLAELKELKKELCIDADTGLTEEEVVKLREKYGENLLEEEDVETLFERIYTQFKGPLMIILLIAGIVTLALKEYVDSTVIFLALFINVAIGIYQEGRASQAFQKLKDSQEKNATVVREGKKVVIPAKDIVPGDIVVIETGMYVPADARILDSSNLAVNESTLTGEWIDVEKQVGDIPHYVPITERSNMVWMGTLVSTGSATVVVVDTGNDTQIGQIATQLSSTEGGLTPLQKNIKKLAKNLAFIVLAALVLIFLLGLFRGEPLGEMLLIAIAIAVAVVPEGLPAAVTVVLALGMESILKKGGLVRNLLAAETLGSTTIILTDKTGTLTRAEMRVASLFTYETLLEKRDPVYVSGEKPHHHADERDVLYMALLTSDAFVEKKGALSEWVVHGRPVERAVLFAGIDSGIDQEELFSDYPRLDSIPFESKNRFSASLHAEKGVKRNKIYFAGAPEALLDHAKYVYYHGKRTEITNDIRKLFLDMHKKKSAEGMRLIGIGYTTTTHEEFSMDENNDPNPLIKDIVFGGLMVLHDPIRGDVPESIQKTKDAGARVIMATGDHAVTAAKIAEESGIIKEGDPVMTGAEIEKLDDSELIAALKKVKVFARVLPHQKLRIARILQSQGEVVAMTGDGVNDAPALRSANIGVALGSGTEVAKEASDLILLNNSFSIIVSAIEEGRRAIDNLKKIIAYLLSTSFSEIFVVGAALLAGTPIPLLPAQILWTNIIQEGFMNFAFAFEPVEKGSMKRDPRKAVTSDIFNKDMKKLIGAISIVTGIFLVVLYFVLLNSGMEIEKVRTFVFVALSIGSLFFTFSLKNMHEPIWKINVFSNKYLIFAFFLSLFGLLAAMFFPPLQKLLSVVELSFTTDLPIILVVGIFNLVSIEITKYFVFAKHRNK